jgi:hypothetical protein
MSNQAWVEPFLMTGEDGAALASSTTATSILPSSRKFTLPSMFADAAGKTLRVRAAGRISNIVTTPGTLTLDLRFGSIVVFNGGAMNLNVVAKTNVTWTFEAYLTYRSIGAGTAATILGIGNFTSESVVGSAANTAGGNGSLNLPVSAPAVGAGFDNTAAQTIDFFATWSISNAGNSITCHQFSLESMN